METLTLVFVLPVVSSPSNGHHTFVSRCLRVCAHPGRQLVSAVLSACPTPPRAAPPRAPPRAPLYSHTPSRKLFSETRQKLHLMKQRECLGTWALVTELIGKTYRSFTPHPPPASPTASFSSFSSLRDAGQTITGHV